MKKFVLLSCMLVLSSCISAKSHDVWDSKQMFAFFKGYKVSLYDWDMKKVSSDYVTEMEPDINTVHSAMVGYPVAVNKIMQRDEYAENFVRPSIDGVIGNVSVPFKYYKNQTYKIVGEVTVDGVRYALLPTNIENVVLLLNEDGTFARICGELKGSSLIIIGEDYIPTPRQLRMVPVRKSSAVQSHPVKGFEIKYGGMELGKILFLYLDYSKQNADKGEFENIYVDPGQELVNIKGVGIKILFADENRLDYMITKY